LTDYCTTAQVKTALDISESDWDTEIAAIITKESAVIDNRLSVYTSTPLTSTPQLIQDICIELCRCEFRFRRAPDTDALNVLRALKKETLNDLQDYITTNYLSEAAVVIAEDRDDYDTLESNK